MKKVYSQKASTEVFALAPEQLAIFKSAGYETQTAEEAIADAGAVRLDLAITVKLRAADYGGQERLVWNGKRYKVERAYTEAREMYELNCSEYREAAEA